MKELLKAASSFAPVVGSILPSAIDLAFNAFGGAEESNRDMGIINQRNHRNNNMYSPNSLFFRNGGIMKQGADSQGVIKDRNMEGIHGGGISPRASNIGVAKGRTHENGGIRTPMGEIEDNESVVQSPYTGDTQIHSDELGYADITNQLAQAKGQLEQKVEQLAKGMTNIALERDRLDNMLQTETNSFNKNKYRKEIKSFDFKLNTTKQEIESLSAQIAEIDAEIENVFQQQEAEKQQMGMGEEAQREGYFLLGGRRNMGAYNSMIEDLDNDANAEQIIPKHYSGKPSENKPVTNANVGARRGNASLSSSTRGLDNNQTNVVTNSSTSPLYSSEFIDSETSNELISNVEADVLSPSPVAQPLSSSVVIADPLETKDGKNPLETKDDKKSSMLPYISNIANAVIGGALSSLRSPKHRRFSSPTLDPNININPQLQNLDSEVASAREQINSNVSSASSARASHASLVASKARVVNQLYGEKSNTERAIQSSNLQSASQIEAANNQAGYQDEMFAHNKKVAGMERISANIANMQSKLIKEVNQDKANQFKLDQFNAAMLIIGKDSSIPVELMSFITHTTKYGYQNIDELNAAIEKFGIKGKKADEFREALFPKKKD
jgi:hypothetical protein